MASSRVSLESNVFDVFIQRDIFFIQRDIFFIQRDVFFIQRHIDHYEKNERFSAMFGRMSICSIILGSRILYKILEHLLGLYMPRIQDRVIDEMFKPLDMSMYVYVCLSLRLNMF